MGCFMATRHVKLTYAHETNARPRPFFFFKADSIALVLRIILVASIDR